MENPVKRRKVRYNFPRFKSVCVCVCRTFSISRLCRSIRNNYITGAYQSRRWTRQLVKGDTFGVSPISIRLQFSRCPFEKQAFFQTSVSLIPLVYPFLVSCQHFSTNARIRFYVCKETADTRGRERERERYRYEDIATWKCNAARANALDPKKNSPAHPGGLKSLDKIEKMESRVKSRRRGLVSDITENITPKCLLLLSRENLPTSPPCSRHGFSRQKITSARSR